jgi:predicted ATPase
VTEGTFKLTEGIFRFEALGAKRIKGRKEPVKVYRVIGPSTRRTRFDISAERGLTFFVGRERELELVMDGFERSRAGRGQVFFITAEAGIGKSRLLYEFRKSLVHEDVTFLEGKCLSYSRNVAYHPVIDILKASFEISGQDSDKEIMNKVNEGLGALGVDKNSMLPYILELLSVKDSGIEDISMSPEVKKYRIIDAIIRVVLRQSELRTLILAIEDLHWIDKSSEETLKALLDSISGARILLMCTYRPEFVPSWKSRSYHCQLNLNRLSNREGLLMVSHLLGTDEFDENIENFILERTEGNPFFIEEFVKSLRDLGIIEKRNHTYCAVKDLQDVAIPSTIQDVIMARVDSLVEEAKKLLQIGSVIGREFSHKLIQELVELPEQELLSHLSVLKDSELLYERGIYPDVTYIFKHALTQDAAYQSLLMSTRQQYHHRVAQILEERFPGTVETQPELLAHHFSEAGIAEKAVPYWQKAGEIAVRRSACAIAVGHFENGIALIKKIPDTSQRDQLELNLQTSLGNTLMTMQGYSSSKVKDTLDRARELCRKAGKTPQLFQVLHGLWIFYVAHGETQTSHELAEQCLDLARRIQDRVYLLEAHHALGSNFLWRGDYLSAQDHFEHGIALYDAQPVGSHILPPGREDPGVIHKSHAAHVTWILGYPEQALHRIQTAHELTRELQHPYSRVFALFSHALLCLFRGELTTALEQAKAAFQISEKQGFGFWQAWSKLYLGSALAALGRGEEGISHLREGIELCMKAGILCVPIHARVFLAEVYGAMGMIAEGLTELGEAEEMMDETGVRFYEEELYRIRGELLLLQEERGEEGAEAVFRRALEIAGHKEAKSLELRAAISLSKLWYKQGKKEEARNMLSEIYGFFTEGFDTHDLKEAKNLLRTLSR